MALSTQFSILIHYSEIGLKGRNQPVFRRQLRNNLEHALRELRHSWPVEETYGYYRVPVPNGEEAAIGPAVDRLKSVFGVAWLAPVEELSHTRFRAWPASDDSQQLEELIVRMAHQEFAPGKTFCVRVTRAFKFVPFTSEKLERHLGEVIRQKTEWDKVNLTRPDVTFYVELHERVAFVFSRREKGPEGLPVGVTGRVLVLLSGGIDSPVAAYLMAKRGCQVDFVHFTAANVSREEAAQQKIWKLAKKLNRFTLGSRLHLVPYTYFDLALMQHQVDFSLVMFRRFMVRTAERLAADLKCEALVTGDNLAQVASQTLSNLASIAHVPKLPLLWPLLGYNKSEIVRLAQEIDTYDLSIEPYKDCCALIAQNPRTRSKSEKISALEEKILPAYDEIIAKTLNDAICLE